MLANIASHGTKYLSNKQELICVYAVAVEIPEGFFKWCMLFHKFRADLRFVTTVLKL